MNDPGEHSRLSWLTLERLAAGDVSASERDMLERALASDPEGARIVQRIRADERALPPLPLHPPGQTAGRESWLDRVVGNLRDWRWALAAGATVAAAALLLLLARPDGARPAVADVPGPRLRLGGATKGGEVAIILVRERAGAITHDPDSYQDGDRFKVLVTCPLDPPLHGDIVVYQGRGAQAETSFPFARTGEPLSCGNRVALPGAFRLSAPGASLEATADAHVCLVFDTDAAPSRSALEHREAAFAARDRTVCATLTYSTYAPR